MSGILREHERVVGTIGRVRDNLGKRGGFWNRPEMYRGAMYQSLECSTLKVGNISTDHSLAFNTGIAIGTDICLPKLPVDEFDAYLQFLEDIYSGRFEVFGFKAKEERISLILGIEETRLSFITAKSVARSAIRYANKLDEYLDSLLR